MKARTLAGRSPAHFPLQTNPTAIPPPPLPYVFSSISIERVLQSFPPLSVVVLSLSSDKPYGAHHDAPHSTLNTPPTLSSQPTTPTTTRAPGNPTSQASLAATRKRARGFGIMATECELAGTPKACIYDGGRRSGKSPNENLSDGTPASCRQGKPRHQNEHVHETAVACSKTESMQHVHKYHGEALAMFCRKPRSQSQV